MSAEGLLHTAQRGIGSADQNRLVVQQTVRRLIHRATAVRSAASTFLYGAAGATRRLKLPAASRSTRST